MQTKAGREGHRGDEACTAGRLHMRKELPQIISFKTVFSVCFPNSEIWSFEIFTCQHESHLCKLYLEDISLSAQPCLPVQSWTNQEWRPLYCNTASVLTDSTHSSTAEFWVGPYVFLLCLAFMGMFNGTESDWLTCILEVMWNYPGCHLVLPVSFIYIQANWFCMIVAQNEQHFQIFCASNWEHDSGKTLAKRGPKVSARMS